MVPHSQAAPHEQLIPPSAGFCIVMQAVGLRLLSPPMTSDVVHKGKFTKIY